MGQGMGLPRRIFFLRGPCAAQAIRLKSKGSTSKLRRRRESHARWRMDKDEVNILKRELGSKKLALFLGNFMATILRCPGLLWSIQAAREYRRAKNGQQGVGKKTFLIHGYCVIY